MAVIDKISFRFRMADEMFARNLYADWERFSRQCVTEILEEFLAAYDSKDIYLEIPVLKVDLGCIPQNRFLEVFPVRFREKLEKTFLPWVENIRADRSVAGDTFPPNVRDKRFENLKHYLEHGFCLTEWDRSDFDLYEELRQYMSQGYESRLLPILELPYVWGRLLSQLEKSQLEKLLTGISDGAETVSFLSLLFSPAFSFGRYERQRFLAVILETLPQGVVRFIHVVRDAGSLDAMAELLENPQVRTIMVTETESHAEIDLPEYWYRLYTWLLEYYPFNGVLMFGDKSHFRLHLNRSLLSFIHKRASSVYLSKEDITLQFLLEVFGADYYLTVLDIIYHNQRLHEDGSPDSSDSYVWELYRILLQLSLLRKGPATGHIGRPQPGFLIHHEWPFDITFLSDMIERISPSVMWLRDVPKDRVREALKLVLRIGVAAGAFSGSDSMATQMQRCMELLYEEITGQKLPPDDSTYARIVETVGLSAASAGRPVAALKAILSDVSIPEWFKRILVLQWFDTYRDREEELVSALQSEGVSDIVFDLLDETALQNIIMRLAGQIFYTDSPGTGTEIVRFVGCLVRYIGPVAELVSRPLKEVWLSLLVTLVSWRDRTASLSTSDAVVRLLSVITGNDSNSMKTVVESLISQLLRIPDVATADNERTYPGSGTTRNLPDAADNFLLSLLLRVKRSVSSEKRTVGWSVSNVFHGNPAHTDTALYRIPEDDNPDVDVLNEARTAFEHYQNDTAGLIGWLRDYAHTSVLKREVFRRYMNDSPKEAICLLRETVAWDESTVDLWAEIIGMDAVFHLLGQSDPILSDRLLRTIGAINTVVSGTAFFTGSREEWERSVEKALLLFWAEKKEDVVTMNEEKIVSLYLRHLHHILTGNREYTDTDRGQWETMEQQVVRIIMPETPIEDLESDKSVRQKTTIFSFEVSAIGQEEKLFEEWTEWLLSSSVSDTEKSQILRRYARWQPEQLWKLVRYAASATPGRKSVAFVSWGGWLGEKEWLEMISGVSLSLGEILIQTVRVVAGKYGLSDSLLTEGLIRFVASSSPDRIHYGNVSEIVRRYLKQILALSSSNTDVEKRLEQKVEQKESEYREKQTDLARSGERSSVLETVVQVVEEELQITDVEQMLEEPVQPEYIEVPNAGLCLLAIWFTRLFGMLGLLEEKEDGKKDLKDTEARIRAIFILQRIVTDEPREYKEQELAFNRILTGCPFHVPLPKTFPLTILEIQTVESMLSGVKANWDKLKNTSVKGFQHSFIERPGKLEQREDKWVLYVEKRSYDILLDSLPWSYRQIRLPWLKKKINVVWRDKEEFEFSRL